MRVLVSERKAGFILVLEELIEVLTSTKITLPFGSNLCSCSAVQNVRGQTTGLQEATFCWVDKLPVPDWANGLERGGFCDLRTSVFSLLPPVKCRCRPSFTQCVVAVPSLLALCVQVQWTCGKQPSSCFFPGRQEESVLCCCCWSV